MPEKQSVRVIEIVSRKPFSKNFSSSVKLLGSQDNQVWEQITAVRTYSKSLRIGKEYIQRFIVESPSYRYWKVHFGHSARRKQVLGRVNELVRVYGYSELVK
ncbi:MAG: hypothetical protein D6719_12480 [Candidatus Dadabacteria bacterium]|nr:MAG: hypothetical protein D6719_12480 [Candidatus Dadabacteria bacterium]